MFQKIPYKHYISELISLWNNILDSGNIPNQVYKDLLYNALKILSILAVRVWGARNPNADVLGQSQSTPPSPSPSKLPHIIFCVHCTECTWVDIGGR